MHTFKATIDIIGINPFVSVPEKILQAIFKQSGKDKGHIPVCGTINGKKYTQTLVRFRGDWRLYINNTMLKDSPKKIGDSVAITIAFDSNDRTIKPHPKLEQALKDNLDAKKVFDQLPPSRQKEIVRYISNLKTEQSILNNIDKAIGYLKGENKFVGRDKL